MLTRCGLDIVEAFLTVALELAQAKKGYPVLLAPPLGGDVRVWGPLRLERTEGWAPIPMSLRAPSVAEVGSAPSPTLSRTVEDLISAIDSLGFSDYGFCGVSLGASIGLALAASDPRLKHLIVGSTLPYIPPLSQWTDRAEALEALGALESIVEPTLRRWLSHEFRQLEPVATQEIRSMLATQSLHDYGFACRVASTIDLRERLPAVNAAVTWIIGSEDAATLPSEQARAAKRLPDCTAIVVEGAAHLVPFERPSAFNEAIRSIVNQA